MTMLMMVGLRGPMGVGYNRMNELTVIQAAQGLILYLEEVLGREHVQREGIVVGYDHRALGTLNSRRFGELTAAVALHRGIKVFLYEGIVATPMVVSRHLYICSMYHLITDKGS